MLDIKLMPAAEVLKISVDAKGAIKLETPIDLTPGGSKAEEPVQTAAKPVMTLDAGADEKTPSKVISKPSVSPTIEKPAEHTTMLKAEVKPATTSAPIAMSTPRTPAPAAPTSAPKPPKIVAAPQAPAAQAQEIEIQLQPDVVLEVTSVGLKQVSLEPAQTKSNEDKTQSKFSAALSAPIDGSSRMIEINLPEEEKVEPVEMIKPVEIRLDHGTKQSIAPPPPVVAAPTPPVQQEIPTSSSAYLFSENGNTSVSMAISKQIENQVPPPNLDFTKSVRMKNQAADGDIDVLKDYLSMREQDIAILKTQLLYSQEELNKANDRISQLEVEKDALSGDKFSSDEKIRTVEDQKNQAVRKLEFQMDQLNLELKNKSEQIRTLEESLRQSDVQTEKLKERVCLDIRKIRVREKELESRLEILKRDSEILIASRENKILELKRKIDLLEFNFDMLVDKNESEKRKLQTAKEKEEKAARFLKSALELMAEAKPEAEVADAVSKLIDLSIKAA